MKSRFVYLFKFSSLAIHSIYNFSKFVSPFVRQSCLGWLEAHNRIGWASAFLGRWKRRRRRRILPVPSRSHNYYISRRGQKKGEGLTHGDKSAKNRVQKEGRKLWQSSNKINIRIQRGFCVFFAGPYHRLPRPIISFVNVAWRSEEVGMAWSKIEYIISIF